MKDVFSGAKDLIGKIVKVKVTKAGYPYNEGQFVKVVEDSVTKSELFIEEETAI